MIKDQLDNGIIERVDQSEKVQPCHQIHYLPHHCVMREDNCGSRGHRESFSHDSHQERGQRRSALSVGG